jgi:hypothetical protein
MSIRGCSVDVEGVNSASPLLENGSTTEEGVLSLSHLAHHLFTLSLLPIKDTLRPIPNSTPLVWRRMSKRSLMGALDFAPQ